MGKKQTMAQLFADQYSQHGPAQIMVGIFHCEFAIYCQVSHKTAEYLNSKWREIRSLTLLEEMALSVDGLTCCWTFKRSAVWSKKAPHDWRAATMFKIADVMRSCIPDLLEEGLYIPFVDYTQGDRNSLQALAVGFT